ncbi:hypothetical protein PIB30_094276 [Stylosanthes scabra]|uniref:Uncharacterized protein n=1 Tax=Stylosanthes scabra TaxID=79078 RepID=A0ABU6TVY9_9FABA|nr:hypothetical protein [Stylosanthes scabra]
MAMVRPRGEPSHIRPKLPSCMARPRSPLNTPARPAQWPWCVRILALGALGMVPGRAACPRPLMARPREPTKMCFGPPKGPRARALSMARPRDGVRRWTTRKSIVAKGKGKLVMPPTRKSLRLAGLPPSLPPTSPKSVLGPNKLLVLAIAAAKVETCPKAQENIQAQVVKTPTDIKRKKTTRISVKPLRKWFSQRIIASGGPSRPKPKKVEVIDLISDEEEDAQEKEAAME